MRLQTKFLTHFPTRYSLFQLNSAEHNTCTVCSTNETATKTKNPSDSVEGIHFEVTSDIATYLGKKPC